LAAEEEEFTRYTPSKVEQKKRKNRQSQTGFEDVDDFGDLAALVKKQKKKGNEMTVADLRKAKKKEK